MAYHRRCILTERTSRAVLFDSDEEITNEEYVPAHIEFDVVEVDTEEEDVNNGSKTDGTEAINDEFAFPLFLFGGGSLNSNGTVMKVSLKEPEIEELRRERPELYYFARYDDLQKTQFAEAAISYETIVNLAVVLKDWSPWKVLDLKEYNSQFDDTKRKRKRPGKKKRESKVECRKRKEDRKTVLKKLEKEREKLLKKKIFHKRGGKKHKKKPEPTKTKYRTE